jgi:hypothetical protein
MMIALGRAAIELGGCWGADAARGCIGSTARAITAGPLLAVRVCVWKRVFPTASQKLCGTVEASI